MRVRQYFLRDGSGEPFPPLQETAQPWASADSPTCPVLTVSELTQQIQDFVEEKFAVDLWVQGELSDPKIYPSGHLWFDLKDEQSALKAVMWRDNVRRLKFRPEHGLQVICAGRVEFYPRRGEIKFSVRTMEPKGMGALQLAFEQLKNKLQQEGLFAEERKRPLPVFPERVGLVTSPQGAAVDDMLRILRSHVEVVLKPTRVQGDGAAESIARGLRDLNALDDLDLLIIGRGGGSLEDLWAFNEEVLARAVFHSRLPVISAVGHEKDVTISDLVADTRAPTPTKAAEMVLAQRRTCYLRLARILEESAFVEMDLWIEEQGKELKDLETGLLEALEEPVRGAVHRLQILNSRLLNCSPQAFILHEAARLHRLEAALNTRMEQVLDQLSAQMHGLAGRLNALSPLAVLERGYSITFDSDGKILCEAQQVQAGQEIQTQLHRGRVTSRVEKTGE